MHGADSSNDESWSDELNSRVTKLENAFTELKKSSSSPWQNRIEVLSKLLLPLLLFWLAFTFKDSVQQALEYQRLEVESAGAIKKILTTLHQEEVNMDEAMGSALTLSAYGSAAIMPLVGVLEHGSSNAETAAKQGLFILGLSHPDTVSQSLGTVLSKRKGQFRWQTHQAMIEILGKVEYPEASEVLLSYGPLLEKPSTKGLIGWKQVVRDATIEDYEETQQTLKDALAVFGVDWGPSAGDKE